MHSTIEYEGSDALTTICGCDGCRPYHAPSCLLLTPQWIVGLPVDFRRRQDGIFLHSWSGTAVPPLNREAEMPFPALEMNGEAGSAWMTLPQLCDPSAAGHGGDVRLPGIHSLGVWETRRVVTPPHTEDDRPPPDNTACPSPPATASTPGSSSELRKQKWKRGSTSPQRPSHPITNLYAPGDAPLDSQHPSTGRNVKRSARVARRANAASNPLQSQHRIRYPLGRQREADHMDDQYIPFPSKSRDAPLVASTPRFLDAFRSHFLVGYLFSGYR